MPIQKRGKVQDIRKLGVVGLFVAISMSAISTIWAIYLDSILHNPAYVGLLTALFLAVGTLTYVFGISFLEKSHKTKAYAAILVLLIASYLLFSFVSNLVAIIALGFIVAILRSLRWSLFGIIVRDKTEDKDVAKNEGFVFTLLNVAFFVGPVLAGWVASYYGLRSVFFLAAVLLFFALISLKVTKLEDGRRTKKVDKNSLKVFLEFFKSKDRFFAYVLGGGIDFWWVLIYIFVPIYVFEQGFGEALIGYFLAAIAVPLISLEYLFGKYVGKKGFKKVFFIGFFILGLAALVCFFVSNVYVMLAILVLASVGAAMIEPTTEAYFFDVIKKRERDKFYPIYNTTINVNSILARVLSAGILFVLPFKSLFILFAVFMFARAAISIKVKDRIEDRA